MVVGVPAAGGLLLLPPLLQLPQVGRRRSARAPRGGCELGAPRPGLTPVPTGGAGLRRRQLRPLGPVPPSPQVPAPGPLEQPVARGEAPLSAVIGLGTGLCRWPGTVCPGSEPKALVASPGDSQDRPSSKRPGGASSSGPALAW
ncbi:transmembrane protein 52 isoform X2 [Herpailurus yagouaroundi]|uniref:transmembrane protein 52 isoform X2 n=1 Tax=Herpailurus yagouaroundi TaxID=1608482 RepID=UPI001AD71A97|nr:transmembrane protein 52 isoform X2 [Puma yagouaroundi]